MWVGETGWQTPAPWTLNIPLYTPTGTITNNANLHQHKRKFPPVLENNTFPSKWIKLHLRQHEQINFFLRREKNVSSTNTRTSLTQVRVVCSRQNSQPRMKAREENEKQYIFINNKYFIILNPEHNSCNASTLRHKMKMKMKMKIKNFNSIFKCFSGWGMFDVAS